MKKKNNLPKLFSPKQEKVYKDYLSDTCRFIILDGAKRAGKTQINNFIFMNEIRRVAKKSKDLKIDNPLYLLGGFSVSSVEKNVLMELRNTFGIEIKLNKYNIFKLLGVNVVVFGHGTIRDASRIRGMTAFGAYINEGSLAKNEAFKEVNSRCSIADSRIIVDTNPDVPSHWLKTDYIDKADNVYISRYHFTLFDNTFLDKSYVDSIVATTPSGMFYLRDIMGEWCVGEGLVYVDFDKDKHLIEEVPNYFDRYIAGVDWGYGHYGSIVVLGVKDGIYYLLEEEAHQNTMIDTWLEIALDFQKKYLGLKFYCDSARPEYVNTFIYNGLLASNGIKRVLSGVEYVAYCLKKGKLFFKKDKFKRGFEEIYQYSWIKNSDVPEKKNDDVLDSLRYAIYTDFIMQGGTND